MYSRANGGGGPVAARMALAPGSARMLTPQASPAGSMPSGWALPSPKIATAPAPATASGVPAVARSSSAGPPPSRRGARASVLRAATRPAARCRRLGGAGGAPPSRPAVERLDSPEVRPARPDLEHGLAGAGPRADRSRSPSRSVPAWWPPCPTSPTCGSRSTDDRARRDGQGQGDQPGDEQRRGRGERAGAAAAGSRGRKSHAASTRAGARRGRAPPAAAAPRRPRRTWSGGR